MNGPATCLEKTCKDASCPSGSSCDDTGVDGYVCRCDDAYIPAEAANGADVSCIERTCEDPGLGSTIDDNHCGTHATCTDLYGSGYGIACSCEGAFEGDEVFNAKASCTERTCANVALSLIHI